MHIINIRNNPQLLYIVIYIETEIRKVLHESQNVLCSLGAYLSDILQPGTLVIRAVINWCFRQINMKYIRIDLRTWSEALHPGGRRCITAIGRNPLQI